MPTRATRRQLLATLPASAGVLSAQARRRVTKYVRFRRGNAAAYGILDGQTIREIQGDLFGSHKETGTTHKLPDVKLLYPCEPPKVLAVGRNYKSHIGKNPEPSRPEIFYKPTSSLQNPEDPIVIPKDAKNVHFEGELVIVMGKRARNVSATEAPATIFGVTCGNDVSERDWQGGPDKDMQWWRAKGADTFGPLGPAVVTGLDYSKLLLQTRVNGEVKQKQSTADLVFDCHRIVSWISQAVTLVPGDVIYTGTPGTTSKLNPGDVVEIEIEGIGVLRNKVTA
jgi:2-keto-4-pentenoate hydratase/2-oxohepta-3-ene-1,7-dioic acid hydratase in catechol pathway